MEKIGADAAKLVGLTIDLIQKIRAGKITLQNLEWFNMLSAEERNRLAGNVVEDSRFKLVKTFELIVPADYNHATRLDDFWKKFGDKFYYFNKNITDNNFRNATVKLAPEKKLKVRLFEIVEHVGSEDCLAFLKAQNAVLVGAQGASLVQELAGKELPSNEWCVSFDEKDALWRDTGGYRRVPEVDRYLDGGWCFNLGDFENDWGGGACLFCFGDLPGTLPL